MNNEATVPVALLQAIADYLTTKPYREVAQMLAGLQQAKPVEPPATPKADK